MTWKICIACCSSSPQLGQENILTPPPPHGRDLPHATPPPLLLCPILSDVSGKLQSPYIPSFQTDLKKTVHTPTPEGMCPMPPSRTPLDFLEELQCPNIPPHVVLTVTNNTKAQMLDTLFIVWVEYDRPAKRHFVHVGKICHIRIFFVCSELLGLENKENPESKLIQPTTDVIIHWTFIYSCPN